MRSKGFDDIEFVLTDAQTGLEVHLPLERYFNGAKETTTITDARAPHKPSSTGRIYTHDGREYYPSVVGLRWIPASRPQMKGACGDEGGTR